ncbi:MAG TPA: SIS domain-containing protein, partial [Trebonia sp.]|nr:SIS domain-containing protein [Trebonia sp.]
VEERARTALSTPDILNLRLVLITGSGDSNIAARAAQFAWQHLGGVPTFADDAMTAARYRLDGIADGQRFRPLVVAVSNSGEVARVVEAAQRARGDGAYVLAVSSGTGNRLAAAADSVLTVAAPPSAAAPGVRSYAMSLLGLFHLAVRIGEVRGRYTMDKAGELRREIAGLADAIEASLDKTASAAARIAGQWHEDRVVEYLGSGPGRASAAYGAAKLLEASGVRAYDQDIEEFVHLQYFAADTGTPCVLIVPGNSPARTRAEEVSRLLRNLGRPAVTLSSIPMIGEHLPQPAGVSELWQPLLHIAPLALLACESMSLRNEQPGRGGRAGWADAIDGMTTRASEILAAPSQPN